MGGVLPLSVDVTKPETIDIAIQKGIERFGSINVLANIAGISSYETFEETTDEEVRNVMETNFWGTYNTCRALIKYFRENNNGTIINCTSIIGLVPRTHGVAYCSSKHAIEGLTGVLWLETQNFNCRVMSVEPGLYPSNIAKDKKSFFETKFQEYIFPNSQVINLQRNYKNDLQIAVNSIIDTVENEKMPRRLLLGKDCIKRVRFEIKSLLKDIKFATPISSKIAMRFDDKHYTFIDDLKYEAKRLRKFLSYLRWFILEKLSLNKEKKNYYLEKQNSLLNQFKETWLKKC